MLFVLVPCLVASFLPVSAWAQESDPGVHSTIPEVYPNQVFSFDFVGTSTRTQQGIQVVNQGFEGPVTLRVIEGAEEDGWTVEYAVEPESAFRSMEQLPPDARAKLADMIRVQYRVKVSPRWSPVEVLEIEALRQRFGAAFDTSIAGLEIPPDQQEAAAAYFEQVRAGVTSDSAIQQAATEDLGILTRGLAWGLRGGQARSWDSSGRNPVTGLFVPAQNSIRVLEDESRDGLIVLEWVQQPDPEAQRRQLIEALREGDREVDEASVPRVRTLHTARYTFEWELGFVTKVEYRVETTGGGVEAIETKTWTLTGVDQPPPPMPEDADG